MGKSLDEIWKKIEKKKAEDRYREYREFYSKELKREQSRIWIFTMVTFQKLNENFQMF